MGVLGLAGYVADLPSLGEKIFWKPGSTSGAKFFIDGNAYVHHLYVNSNLDWIYGGQYAELATMFMNQIKAMQSAGIEVKFFFDGPLHSRKEHTRMLRNRGNIDRIKGALKNMAWLARKDTNSEPRSTAEISQHLFVIPPLALDVCVQALRHDSIEFQFCDGEADGEVARQARKVKGYAVSRDSDFFVYNLEDAAYIPLDMLTILPDGVSAMAYHTSKIATHFALEMRFMPVFASIMGNDYLSGDLFRAAVRRHVETVDTQVSKSWFKRTASFVNYHAKQSKSMEDMLFCIVNAIPDLPEHITRQELLQTMQESIRQYDYPQSDSDATQSAKIELPSGSKTFWSATSDRFRNGRYSFKILDVVQSQKFWCIPFVEDLDRESSWMISRQLRQWMYSIVLIPAEQHSSLVSITEYVRHAHHVGQDIVDTMDISEIASLAKLDAVNRSNISAFENSLPLFLRLHQCNPENMLSQSLQPSILSLIAILRYLIHNAASPFGDHQIVQKFSNHEIVAIIVSTITSLASILWPDQPTLTLNLSASLPTRRGLEIAAQLQTTLISSYLLAQALDLDDYLYPPPSLSQYFNGQSLHYYLRNAKGGATIERMVGKRPVISSLCHQVLDIVMAGWQENEVEIIFQYNQKSSERKKNPNSEANNRKVLKKKAKTTGSDNMFNVLSSGCRW
ncbi:hypothetical protein INT43_003513 [Umbelopsis isabellina]|uniref:Asteroid domain-containing protein n=1 Tax=Mortierella isabellina TaxID=91625 RepID=A0A8H7PR54_MORIS|nr:hypothetical protein INT43_003513 [Umbelopsis isabellina]